MELINKPNETSVLQQSQIVLPNTPRTLSSFPTYHSFTERFTPDHWEDASRKPTQCVTCSSPTLTDINLAYGEGKAIAWLMAQLTVFQEKLSVPNKMSVYEVETCAQTIHDYYHHLKTTELMLFFARLLGGMYNVDWHGYVTPTKIVTALREEFMPWRNDLLHKIDEKNKKQQEKEYRSIPTMTWDEYCQLKGIDKKNPLDRMK